MSQTRINDLELKADKIKVIWDGTEYVCENHAVITEDDPLLWEYGAIYDNEKEEFDFSVYPFNIYYADGDSNVWVNAASNDAVTVQITAINETEAVWKKVGEGSSPTPPTPTPSIEGDLENGCTIQPSAWNDEHVDVPLYIIEETKAYELYLDGEYIKTETAHVGELDGGAYVQYDFGSEINPYFLSFFNAPDGETTNVWWVNPPNTAVTIQLVLNDAS